MPDTELTSLTVHEARQLLDTKKISSVELTQAHLDRIEAVEPKVASYVTVTPDLALEQAAAADKRIASGNAAPLTGIPLQLKDNMSSKGVRTTCSSKMLENFVPPYDATVWNKISAQGGVLLGKGNLDEFAMGSSTENSAFNPTKNPWDLGRVPGGSSGGPAAAVAARECLFSLGSDTGGSIRQPASLCGIVGLKPTYGRVSRYGLVAFASSLDQIGPMTRSVEDAAIVLGAIAGHDPSDSTSLDAPVPDYTASLGQGIEGMRIGVPKEYFVEGMEPGVEKSVREAIKVLEGLGAKVSETSLPTTEYALAVYYIIAPSEASANLARYDGAKYGYSADAPTMFQAMEQTKQHGFGPEVKRRIMLGTYALSAGFYDAYYLRAQKVRTLIRREFSDAFTKFDALVTPTSPSVAFKLGAKTADPYQMYLNDVFTIPVNIAGLPAISVPGGFSDNLPVGLQLIGKPLAEGTLFRVAHAYQNATDWHVRTPDL